METIKSITEAFSMQPVTLSISKDRSIYNPEDDIEKIELEVMDEDTNVYVGYDFQGVKKFQYIAKSVNVYYV